ncbi:MAG: hypothetical protein RIE53_00240 [Rhodothermales bacterium]
MPAVEYFVPIPLKCIGRHYKNDDGPDEGANELLRGITSSYPECFGSEDTFSSWWRQDNGKESVAVETNRYMTTPEGVGYYELISQYDNNILIGYSQGGLVARYLAFLDRYVFKLNKIRGVVTIGCPNYGSPFANPRNRDRITDALIEFVLSMISVYGKNFESTYSDFFSKLSFEDLNRVLESMYMDAKATHHGMEELLATALKWLSGLNEDPSSAFHDLSTENLMPHREYSTLALVNNPAYSMSAHGVKLASIIGANNSFQEILGSLMSALARGIILPKVAGVDLFGSSLKNNMKKASEVYSERALADDEFDDAPEGCIAKELHRWIREGRTITNPHDSTDSMEPYLHDFIIPAAYQCLPEHEVDVIVGQYLNEEASHNSGKDPRQPAGQANYTELIDLLEKLRDDW